MDGNMSRKGFQKGARWAAKKRQKNGFFNVRSCLGARMAPKSPQASILEALVANFEPFLAVFESFFCRRVSFLSAPAVGRRSNRKQLTAHSKLNDGCDDHVMGCSRITHLWKVLFTDIVTHGDSSRRQCHIFFTLRDEI